MLTSRLPLRLPSAPVTVKRSCHVFRCRPCTAQQVAARVPSPCRRRDAGITRVAGASAGHSDSSSSTSSALQQARKQLKELEDERDLAVATAESSARAAMKLTDLVGLLENMALEKVKAGDEETARQVLLEKAATKEALDKTSAKAQVNYALAATLAQKIGAKQTDILALLKASGAPAGTPVAPPPAPPAAPSPPPPATATSSYASFGASTSNTYSSAGGSQGGYTPMTPKWQQSLEEARERISAAEKAAERAGRAARLGAEESIAEARDRLRARANESIFEASSRLTAQRRNAEESIAEAQERLRKQDAEVLAYVRRVMERYRRGDYVSEDELEFAFQQLEKRFVL